jgi:hypothetical protein
MAEESQHAGRVDGEVPEKRSPLIKKSSYGQVCVDNVEYLVKHPGSRPYCHYCKKYVKATVLICENGSGPRRACLVCLDSGVVPAEDVGGDTRRGLLRSGFGCL